MKNPSNGATGFTLIEVLVALIVVTIGLIGMAGIQAAAVKYTKGAEGRNHAAQLSSDILDRIRTSRATLEVGGYSSAGTSQAVACNRDFINTTAVQDQADIALWRNQVACLLPLGQGRIQIGARDATTGLFPVTIFIQWSESRIISGEDPYPYIVRAQL